MLEISIVIPAYNEEKRLPATLTDVYDYLTASGRSFEIIIVNDGSSDRTAAVVQELARTRKEVRLITYALNRGKGYAVRTGVLNAQGSTILTDDADGSSPIAELAKLEQALGQDIDIAFGSRAKKSTDTVVRGLAHRKFMGNTFNLIVQSLLLPRICDTQCGFKLYRQQAAMDIFSRSRVDGYGFDVECLYIARVQGYKVEEVPINWNHVAGSKVNVLLDSPRMLVEVLGIVFSAVMGRYKRLSSQSF